MLNIITQVLILFIYVLIGFIITKINIIDKRTINGISSLVIKVLLPSLILSSMNGQNFNLETLKNSYYLIIIGFFYYSFAFFYSSNLVKYIFKSDWNLYILLMVFANVGYMGYPIVKSFFGETGIFYAAIYNFSHGIFLWTIGISLMKNSNNNFKIHFKFLLNPGMISIILGFLFFIINFKIPQVIYIPMKNLGDACTPLAMMVIGSTFNEINLKSIFKKDVFILANIKMLIIPMILFIILSFIDIDNIVKGIIILISSMPCGANSVIFAKEYNKNYHLATRAVMFTTMFSVLSLPLILFLIF